MFSGVDSSWHVMNRFVIDLRYVGVAIIYVYRVRHLPARILPKNGRRWAISRTVDVTKRDTRSSRPDVLAYTLDPVAELVDAGIPLLQSAPHALDLLHI
jgi:hypothetical protein